MGFGVSTASLGATTTSQTFELPPRTVMLLIRAASGNTDTVRVGIGIFTAGTGNMIVRAGESISFDFSDSIMLARQLQEGTEETDFPRIISLVATSGTQTVYIDAFPCPA